MQLTKKKFANTGVLLSTMTIVLLFVILQLAFSVRGPLSISLAHYASLKTVSLHWLALSGLKIVSEIIKALLISWFALLVMYRGFGLGGFIRKWIIIVLAGLGMTTWLIVDRSSVLYTSAVFNAILPILRNYVPLVTGLLIAGALISVFETVLSDWRFRLISYAVLIIPVLFNKDIFGFSLATTAMSAVVMVIASVAAKHLTDKKNVIIIVVSAVLLIFSYIVLVPISFGTTGSLSMVTHFSMQMSPLIILPAASIAWLFFKKMNFNGAGNRTREWNSTLAILSVGLFSSALYLNKVNTLTDVIKSRIGTRLGLWMILSGIVIMGAICLTTVVLHSALHFSWLWRKTFSAVGQMPLIVFLNHAKDNGWDPFVKVWRHYRARIFAFVSFWVTWNITALLMNQSFNMQDHIANSGQSIFEYILISRAATMFFGGIILYAAFMVIMAITNRYWISLISVNFLAIAWAIASRLKMLERSEPITIGDMYEIRAISQLMGMINPIVIITTIIAMVVLIVAVVYLEKRHSLSGWKFGSRLMLLVVSVVFLGGFKNINHDGSYGRNIALSFHNSSSIYNQMICAQDDGPILQFLNGMDVEVMAKPAGYSKNAIMMLTKKYKKVADKINSNRPNNIDDFTVIFNLSESFADPTRMPNLTINRDPIPNVRKMKNTNTSGLMMSYGYGGGTANMEWESLTGTSLGNLDTGLSTPYTQLVTKLTNSPSINQYFGYSAGIHPYLGTFYGRSDAYARMKFNKFEYLGSKYKIRHQKKLGKSNYLSDYTAYANVVDQLDNRKGSQFINLVTMQNHMPFSAGTYKEHDFKISGTAYGNASGKSGLEGYIQGIHYTDIQVEKFKKNIDKMQRPIIWVWYGDHLPALYNGDNTPSNAVLTHETDYFVYANKYAREHGAKTKLSDSTSVVGPNTFGALAFNQANAKVDSYMALLTQVQQKLPTIWSKNGNSATSPTQGMQFVNDSSKLQDFGSLSNSQKELLHDYQLIQYDIDAGKQYSLKDGFIKF